MKTWAFPTAVLLLALIGYLDLKSDIKSFADDPALGVPEGTVAFFEGKCPQPAWQVYTPGQGRFPLAANPQVARGLSKRETGATGGAEYHRLTVPQLPGHRIIKGTNAQRTGDARYMHVVGPKVIEPSGPMHMDGKAAPHNNMPPFIVLTQCVKRSKAIQL